MIVKTSEVIREAYARRLGDPPPELADAGAVCETAEVVTDALDPVQVVERWQARAWGDFDLTAVDELVSDPLRRHGPSGTTDRSHDELKGDLRQYQRTLCKPAITVNDRVVQGDCVWSRVTMRGHNIDTGEPHAVEWIQVHRVVDGLIVELWSLYASGVIW